MFSGRLLKPHVVALGNNGSEEKASLFQPHTHNLTRSIAHDTVFHKWGLPENPL